MHAIGTMDLCNEVVKNVNILNDPYTSAGNRTVADAWLQQFKASSFVLKVEL